MTMILHYEIFVENLNYYYFFLTSIFMGIRTDSVPHLSFQNLGITLALHELTSVSHVSFAFFLSTHVFSRLLYPLLNHRHGKE